MKIFLSLFTFILISQMLNAQLPDYFVFTTHGNIWIKHGDKSAKVEPKQLVYQSDVIEIKDQNSELELVNRENNFVPLNSRGIYLVRDLKKKPVKKTLGIIGKYFELLWNTIFNPSSQFNINKMESVGGSWGGGERGIGCSIEKFPVGNIFFANDSLIFKWKYKNHDTIYHFNLYDSSQNPIIELLVRDTQLVLLTHFLACGEYYWSINSISNPCNTSNQNKITLISREKENIAIDSLTKKIPFNRDEIQYNLQISDLLGKRGYIEKALEYFNKSWNLFMMK